MSERTQPAIGQQIQQLERFVRQLAEVQARQIDREKSVPGTHPQELEAIEIDLALVQGIAHKLHELEQGSGRAAVTRNG